MSEADLADRPGGSQRTGRPSSNVIHLAILVLFTLLIGACSSAPYRHGSFEQLTIQGRAVTRSTEELEIQSALLNPDESEALFGIPTHDRDVQPVWLKITNRDDVRARIAFSSIDPKYFPPAEVAYFFRKKFSKEGWMELEARLIDMALPRFVEAGETVSGFVFTNHTPGTKAFNLDVFRASLPPTFEQFTFFLREPGFKADYENIEFRNLYSEEDTIYVDSMGLGEELKNFDCCTQNADGTERGRPVTIYIVSDGLNLLRALLRAGWLETPRSQTETETNPQYLFGRPADGVFRTPRDKQADRSQLRIWKTPVVVDGKPMWAGQLRHAIGRRFEIEERLFGVHVDPDTTDGRDYVLQKFWYAQALEQWAFSATGVKVPQDSPVMDFQGNSWFSRDEYQVVMWISPTPVAMTESTRLVWPENEDSGESR